MTSGMAARGSGSVSMSLLMVGGLATFLAWAAWFEVDQTVRAQGQLIPAARTQVIQAADGGVLASILAKEGQTVAAGERLAVLERIRPNAAYEESRAKLMSVSAALLRATAEATGRPLRFGKEFDAFPEFVRVQRALYEQRKRGLQQELGTLQDMLTLARDELRMSQSLLETGDISRLEVMRAQRQVGELQGRVNAVRQKYLQDARQEATRLEDELASSRFKLEERESVLNHTVITAPVAGIVKYLKVTTVGGVLRAGDELMQISPTDGGLFVEIKVNPVDVAQLEPDLPATIKLDAYDFSIHGTLEGRLSYLSSDTLTEQGGNGLVNTFYRAQVRILDEQSNRKLADVSLRPGMTATVDLKTDRRSILSYLVKPVSRAFSGALNEK